MANNKNFIAKNGVSTGDGYAMPDIRPSLLLDFANSKTLDPRIKFTRAANGTYWDGYTTTKGDENLARYTDDFTTIYTFEEVTVTRTDTAPDGTASALKMTETTANSDHRVYDTMSYPIGVVTTSVFAKYVDHQYVQIRVLGGGSGTYAGAVYDLQNGTVTDSSNVSDTSITSVGNGWYRLTVTATSDTDGGSGNTVIAMSNTSTYGDNKIYTGTGESVLIWGLQMQTGSLATNYIPTTDTRITRYQPVLQTSLQERFDHDPVTGESKGLLIESAATNLIKCSRPEDTDTFGSNGWQDYYGFRAIRNTVIAPDGTSTGATIRAVVGGGGTGASMYVNNAIVPTNTTDHTFSTYLKRGGERPTDLVVVSVYGNGSAANNYNAKFDLSDGTINVVNNGSAKIEDCGNGWYRCSVTMSLTSGGNYYPQVGTYGNSAVGTTFLMWGAQLEQGSFATSFIPTNGYTVTRDSDLASMKDVSWLNTENFSVLTDSASPVAGGEPFVFQVSNNGSRDRFSMRFRSESSNQGGYMVMVSNSITQLDTIASATVLTRYNTTTQKYNFYKLAMAFEENNAAITDGYGTATDTACVPPVVLSQLTIGANYSTVYSNWIKKIAFYPKRLSNTALQQLVED